MLCLAETDKSVAEDAAGAEVAGGVVGGRDAVDADSSADRGVDEGDFSGFGVVADSHPDVADAAALGRTAGKEQEVAGLHFVAAYFLPPRQTHLK